MIEAAPSHPTRNRVLVLVRGARDASVTAELLGRDGIVSEVCSDMAVLCARIEQGAAAALIAEESLTLRAVTMLATILEQQPAWSDFPIVVFGSSDGRTADSRKRTARLGNVTFLDRPVHVTSMLAAVHVALRARKRQYAARGEIESRDSFLAMLGHELRNPLGAIQLAVSLIQAKTPSAAETKEHKILDRQTRHLSRLVDDLLDVARITHGKVVLKRERLNLVDVLRSAFETTEARAREHRLAYDLELPNEPVIVEGDRQRLDQVLSNLITNALKYTPRGGTVQVALTTEGNRAKISVSDSGIGLEASMLERIFDAFSQVDSSVDRAAGGIGVGLALVRSIVMLHGGTVYAQSEGRDQGSTFVVELPRVQLAAIAPSPVSTPKVTHAKRVLVVEDGPDIRGLMVELLEHEGYEVSAAEDGEEGLAQLLADAPDVAFVDIGLPKKNGFEVAAAAVRGGFRGGLIALSGYGQAEDKRRALAAGFHDHLTKPIAAADLERAIARVERLTSGAPSGR